MDYYYYYINWYTLCIFLRRRVSALMPAMHYLRESAERPDISCAHKRGAAKRALQLVQNKNKFCYAKI